MPALQQFTLDELPEHFGWQMLAFVRIHWFDIYAHEQEADFFPAYWHTLSFIVAQKRALYSAATVVWQDLELCGDTYRVYGLTAVMAYPAFRKNGYGLQVVTAATDYIKQQADADLAILWTGKDLEGFYNRMGWQYPRDFTVSTGDPDNPEISNFPMLLYLSDRGRSLRDSLAGQSLYFGQYSW